MFLSLDLLSEYRIQHGAIGPLYVISSYSTWYFAGEFQALNWLSLRRLVSWINHLPPACWSTFWKSNSKQQLGCRFDIIDYESYFFVFWHMQLYVMIHQIIFRFYLLKYSLFFSSTLVLTSSYRRSLYTFYQLCEYRWNPHVIATLELCIPIFCNS